MKLVTTTYGNNKMVLDSGHEVVYDFYKGWLVWDKASEMTRPFTDVEKREFEGWRESQKEN